MNKPAYQRVFIMIIDSFGIGATSDAGQFGSLGANTLAHVSQHFRIRLQLPNLQKLGLGNISPSLLSRIIPSDQPLAAWGIMQSCSTGISDRESQWEMMGLPTREESTIFPQGFSLRLVNQLETLIHVPLIINKLMSPRTALVDYGEEQLTTGKVILFTDGASTLWLAAHEKVLSAIELKDCCRQVRRFLDTSLFNIEKVYGLSFAGTVSWNFYPTDLCCYLTQPSQPTILDHLHQEGYSVKLIGKTANLFGATTDNQRLKNNQVFNELRTIITENFTGLCATELSEFDYQYGHMRNPEGFGNELMRVDQQIGTVLGELHNNDLLVITANHGNDPTYPGEGHTREKVPLLMYSPSMKKHGNLGVRTTYADLGATILDNYGLARKIKYGKSFLNKII